MIIGERLGPQRGYGLDEILESQGIAGIAGILPFPGRQNALEAIQGEGQPYRAVRFVQECRQNRLRYPVKSIIMNTGREESLTGDMRLLGGGQRENHPSSELPRLVAGVGFSNGGGLAGCSQGPFQLPQIMGVQPGARRQVGNASERQPVVAQQFG